MSDRPLGIADLFHEWELPPNVDEPVYLWCRRHEQAHKVGENCQSTNAAGTITWSLESCIDVGPFMSYGEANRLQGMPNPTSHAPMTWWSALGMEVER